MPNVAVAVAVVPVATGPPGHQSRGCSALCGAPRRWSPRVVMPLVVADVRPHIAAAISELMDEGLVAATATDHGRAYQSCPKKAPRKSGGTSQRGLGNAAGRSGVEPSKEAK
jgi:hypothetical protein